MHNMRRAPYCRKQFLSFLQSGEKQNTENTLAKLGDGSKSVKALSQPNEKDAEVPKAVAANRSEGPVTGQDHVQASASPSEHAIQEAPSVSAQIQQSTEPKPASEPLGASLARRALTYIQIPPETAESACTEGSQTVAKRKSDGISKDLEHGEGESMVEPPQRKVRVTPDGCVLELWEYIDVTNCMAKRGGRTKILLDEESMHLAELWKQCDVDVC